MIQFGTDIVRIPATTEHTENSPAAGTKKSMISYHQLSSDVHPFHFIFDMTNES